MPAAVLSPTGDIGEVITVTINGWGRDSGSDSSPGWAPSIEAVKAVEINHVLEAFVILRLPPSLVSLHQHELLSVNGIVGYLFAPDAVGGHADTPGTHAGRPDSGRHSRV
jgi:hypothetical protein